jgi:quercetin dioxygenase-like cupin family protein
MTTQATAITAQPGEGRTARLGPLTVTWKEEGDRTRGRLAVGEVDLPPGFSPPAHVHREHEEGFYVLAGEVEFHVGDQTIRATPGTWVMVPIGVPHTFTNPGSTPARFLMTLSPNLYVGYFDEVGQLFQSGPPSPAAMLGVMARYATEPAGA